jgi:hypothetical protein
LFGFDLALVLLTTGLFKASVAIGAFDLAYTCSVEAALAEAVTKVTAKMLAIIPPTSFVFVIWFLLAAATGSSITCFMHHCQDL